MNERIKLLADEAAKYSAVMSLPTGKSGDTLFVEMFAELIVAECIDAASEAQADFYVVHNIKSRFGVEE